MHIDGHQPKPSFMQLPIAILTIYTDAPHLPHLPCLASQEVLLRTTDRAVSPDGSPSYRDQLERLMRGRT